MCTYFRSAKRFHRPAACTPQRQLRAINSSLSSSLSSRTLCGSLLFHQASQNKFIDQIQNTICKTLAKYCFDWLADCEQKIFMKIWYIIQNSLNAYIRIQQNKLRPTQLWGGRNMILRTQLSTWVGAFSIHFKDLLISNRLTVKTYRLLDVTREIDEGPYSRSTVVARNGYFTLIKNESKKCYLKIVCHIMWHFSLTYLIFRTLCDISRREILCCQRKEILCCQRSGPWFRRL